MTDIEAVQTLSLLFTYHMPGNSQNTLFPLLQRRTELVLKMCADPVSGSLIPPVAREPEAWISTDLKLRAFVSCLVGDITTAFSTDRDPLHDWFGRPFQLPCHERYWDLENPEVAFGMLREVRGTVVDFSPLVSHALAPGQRRALIGSAIIPVMNQAASYGTLSLVNSFLRLQRMQMRRFAGQAGLHPPKISAQDPLKDTEHESTYRRRAWHVASLVDDVFASLPADIAGALRSADTRSYFANHRAYFPDLAYGHAFFTGCVMLLCASVEVWGDLRGIEQFLGSEGFRHILMKAAHVVKLLEGQMADDPSLRWIHQSHFGSVLRLGYLFLEAGRGEEAKVVHGAVERFGRIFDDVREAVGGFGRAVEGLGTRKKGERVA
jgi:hypothetical protein